MAKTKNGKRILKVVIKRMMDKDPDTSYFGEYSNTRTSEYSIDRAHAEDCASVSIEARNAAQTLEHAQCTVADIQRPIACDTDQREEWDALEDAYILLGEKSEEVIECDCGGHGDMGRHEYRYFNPSLNYVDKHGKLCDGNTAEDVRKYVRQDYERSERLNRGDWCYIGIRAEAEIHVPYMTEGRGGRTYFQTQKITSGGLWGVESDSDESFINETEQEELSDLRAQLLAIGFSKRAISTAFKSVERKDA